MIPKARLTMAILAATLPLTPARGDEKPFYFPDRTGELFPEARLPHTPRIDAPLLSPKPVPEDGFANSKELRAWLQGTVWEFLFPPDRKPGGRLSIVRLILYEKHARLTWDGGNCGWWASDNKSARLRHSQRHWTYEMHFADDFGSFTFNNHWGTAKLVGRIEQ
ncbi:MAG: hypothetical protein AAF585_12670 [Verrucomicrobiota bacterium]